MDDVRYCEYKLLLDAGRFRTPDDFRDFWRRVANVAARCSVDTDAGIAEDTFHVRHVAFFDTPAFDLYRNAFILRRRVAAEPEAAEVTFKYRHPDVERARRVDVVARAASGPQVEFKEEVLQPRDNSCGSRSVYSHNCVLQKRDSDIPQRMDALVDVFPELAKMQIAPDTPVALVNGRTVEERQVETRLLEFGHGLVAKSSVAIWQDAETGHPLTGEFSYQTKFDSPKDVDERARDRAEHLHFKLQKLLVGWVSPGATKTSLIYGGGIGHE